MVAYTRHRLFCLADLLSFLLSSSSFFSFFPALSPATHRFSVRAGSSGDDGAIAVGMNVKDSSPLVAGHTPRPALDTSDGIRVDAALRPAEEDASLMLFIPVICPARMVQP